MRDNVMFKGNKGGLQLLLNASAGFDIIRKQLKDKLAAASGFFTNGSKVSILPGNGRFSEDEQNQIISLLEDYGLCYNCTDDYAIYSQGRDKNDLAKNGLIENALDSAEDNFSDIAGRYCEPDGDSSHTLIVPKVLRGGQKLIYSGKVIVMGNVNPNAQIIAGGDIVIHGTCWGLVHAGAFGDAEATISAEKLMASQIRIANHIARAPDNFCDPQYPETARIFAGKLIIEPQINCLNNIKQ